MGMQQNYSYNSTMNLDSNSKNNYIEHLIQVTSVDRDITVYPNPFEFQVPLQDNYRNIVKVELMEAYLHLEPLSTTLDTYVQSQLMGLKLQGDSVNDTYEKKINKVNSLRNLHLSI